MTNIEAREKALREAVKERAALKFELYDALYGRSPHSPEVIAAKAVRFRELGTFAANEHVALYGEEIWTKWVIPIIIDDTESLTDW